jgi:S1-C subfamily serine protease
MSYSGAERDLSGNIARILLTQVGPPHATQSLLVNLQGGLMQVLPWSIVGVLSAVVAAGALAVSLQTQDAARATFTFPLAADQQVGVVVQDITPQIAEAFSLREARGAVVTALDVGSLQAGDVILSVNGQSVTDRRDFERLLAEFPPTETLIFQVSRNGATREVVIQRTAGTATTDESHAVPATIAPGFRGVRVDNLSAGLTQSNGIVVTDVENGTPAEAAGLRGGDIIVDVNSLPVFNVEQFFSYVEKLSGQRVVLGIIRQGIHSVVIVPSLY